MCSQPWQCNLKFEQVFRLHNVSIKIILRVQNSYTLFDLWMLFKTSFFRENKTFSGSHENVFCPDVFCFCASGLAAALNGSATPRVGASPFERRPPSGRHGQIAASERGDGLSFKAAAAAATAWRMQSSGRVRRVSLCDVAALISHGGRNVHCAFPNSNKVDRAAGKIEFD